MSGAAPVEFQLNEFATIAGSAIAVAAAGATVVLTVEVAPAVWETIDLLEMFHLGLAVRGDGAVSGSAAVQLDLRLDPAVAAAADALPGDPEGWSAVLSAAAADAPVRQHTSWYALSATEAVDVPPELAELGEVRSGFATTWADADGTP